MPDRPCPVCRDSVQLGLLAAPGRRFLADYAERQVMVEDYVTCDACDGTGGLPVKDEPT